MAGVLRHSLGAVRNLAPCMSKFSTISSRLAAVLPHYGPSVQQYFHTSRPVFSKVDGPFDPKEERLKLLEPLADTIIGLDMLEITDLMSIISKKLGLPADAMGMMGMGGGMFMGGGMPMGGMPMGGAAAAPVAAAPAAAAPEAPPPPKEKTEFDVKLDKFDAAQKIKVIKEVRAITGLGLKESKDLVEATPAVLKKGVKKEEADAIVAKLKEVGANVTLE